MPSTYSSNLRLELIASGEQANTWGNTTNTNLGTLLESAIAGRVELSSGWVANSLTLTALNGANDQSRQMCLVVPAITISANSNIVVPASAVTSSSGKLYTVINKSTSYSVTIKLPATTGVTIPANTAKTVIYNGTDFQEAFTALDYLTLTGTPTVSAHAVNKGYVDGKFFINADANTVTGNTTFTGTVTLPVATPTGNQATSYNYVNTNYLYKASGGPTQTMYPYLRLNYTPVNAADAVHKAYVDDNFVGLTNVQTISGTKTFSTNVTLSGSAQLVLPNAPLSGTHATNKTYVDGKVSTAENNALNLFVPKTRTVYAGSGIQVNGTSFGTLDDDITISVVGGGTVTSVTATSPVVATGTTAVNISMNLASSSQSGYLSNTNWSTFNNKCEANGSNATGTSWPISITGNCLGSAGSVAWVNVSGRPTALSQFTNDSGFITSSATVANALNLGGISAASYLTTSDASSTYLPLSAGSSKPLTGLLFAQNPSFATSKSVFGVWPLGGTYYPFVGSYKVDTGSNYAAFAIGQFNNTTLGGADPQASIVIGTTGLIQLNYTTRLGYLAGSGTRDIAVNPSGDIVLSTSDVSLKEDIVTLSGGLAQVNQLNPVSFYWKDKEAWGTEKNIGLIAQEVLPIVPEVVNATDGVLSVSYSKLTATLISAIQELNAKVETLQSEVNALKGA